MSQVIYGIGASPGRALGSVRRVQWQMQSPAHRTIDVAEIDPEVARFEAARRWARSRIEEMRDRTAETLGEVEAKIFEAQALMLDDPDLIGGTERYIRENFLSAERAFEWRLTEFRTAIVDAAHLMIVDRLADLQDIRFRVLARLAGTESDPLALPESEAVLVFDELTPSMAVRLDPALVLGVVTGAGSRTAHSAVLVRSLGIPAVVGVGPELKRITDGHRLLIDGGAGRLVLDPGPAEVRAHREMEVRLSAGSESSDREAVESRTTDGARIYIRANLDQPHDVPAARRVGAEGVGLFRSEFLVIGRRVIPSEAEQYEAYRRVLEGFPDQPVTLRTFDIGGDKFPLFLDMPQEENPYLGWRAIRVCLDLPDLFRNQLRAAIRAGGDSEQMRILVPFVISKVEILKTREILLEVREDLGFDNPIPFGVMVETPALAETLDIVAPHIDFISLGTNDLTQYALAVDRGNARLQHLSDPLHPAMVRLYRRIHESASRGGLDIGVCGDLASDPIGLSLLIALGYRDFSLPPPSIPEMRDLVGALSAEELREVCGDLDDPDQVSSLRQRLREYIDATVPFQITTLSS